MLILFGAISGGMILGSFAIGKNSAKAVAAANLETNASKLSTSSGNKKTDASGSTDGTYTVAEIASQCKSSVVAITNQSVQEVQTMFGTMQQQSTGSGSGVIIGKNDTELLIATNYHVVEGAETLSVGFCDSTACEAKVKGYDSEKDLAVVAVSLDDIDSDTMDAITIATIGNSDDLKVGAQVVAIGNALGYGQSVTTGIVSAKNRKMNDQGIEQDEDSDATNLIQTDAAINPGNSGGALLNMKGEVVGINSAKLASTEVEGMGYAIAISDVTDILQNLMNETSRDKLDDSEHGVLGIKGSSVSSEAVQMYGIPAGVFVKEVTEGGAADKAGLKANSVITEFNGKTVSSINQLIEYLSYYEPDEEVELTVQVPHGTSYKEETVKVTLDENTDADDSDDNDKDSKKSKKDSKKSSKDADEDVDEDTDSEDSMDSDDTEESENPFIQYFENQGFFR